MKSIAAAVLALTLTVVACSDDDEVLDELDPSPTPSPVEESPSPAPTFVPPVTPLPYVPPTPNTEGLTDLAENLAKWEELRIQGYQYEFTVACFCSQEGQPFQAIVRDGELASMLDSSGSVIANENYLNAFRIYATIPWTFEQAEVDLRTAFGVTVTYNEQYGFPETIEVGSRGPTDTSSFVTIFNFEVIE